MQERNTSAGETAADGCPVTQFDEFARNMVRLFDQGAKVFSTLAERSTTNGNGPYSMTSEVGEAAKTLGEVARVWVGDPGKLVAAQGELFQSYADLWGRSVRRFFGEDVEPVAEPEPGDNRFKDPDWSDKQFFDFWKQAYLITSRWAEDMTRNTEGVDEKTHKKAMFYLEQMLAALSPSNFAFTNPEVVRDDARHQCRESRARHDPVGARSRAVAGSACASARPISPPSRSAAISPSRRARSCSRTTSSS